jgi:hypothetical protein
MAKIGVIDGVTGQMTMEETESVTVVNVQEDIVVPVMPAEYEHILRVPAANGMKRVAAVSDATMFKSINDRVTAERQQIVEWATIDINALKAADITLQNNINAKMTIPTGTTSQYVRGDGSLASLPSPIDISGKSDKANFAALSTLAAHGQTSGQTNGATNNPTNAPADSKTDYGLVAAILGADVNTANTKQNQTASNVNVIATNLNALATKYNELAIKFNALLTWLTTSQGYQNNLRAAGAA